MRIGDSLQIYPSELKFGLHNSEKDELSCVMQLSNITSHNVAYKVFITHPTKYYVRPKRGIILPGSTCDVTVLMQAPKKIKSHCKDELLIQCVAAEHSPTFLDNMIIEDSGKVEELALKIVYVPNTPPSLVPYYPEEAGLSTLSSTSEIGSKNP